MNACARFAWRVYAVVLIASAIGLGLAAPVAHAQGPVPLTEADKVWAIVQLGLDTLQGKATLGADAWFTQAQQSATQLLASNADLFFLDFGNPNLPLNQFAATLARNLLALTPLYGVAYLGLLVINLWKEKPIPNPILYAALVAGVMIFLAAFGLLTQGLGELGRALAATLGGAGNALFVRATLLDTVLRALVALQKNGGVLAPLVLLVVGIEAIIILIQLAYRGISLALWRLFGVLLIPLSVLLEGVQPKTAGRVIAGFFEAWLDFVGKLTVLLIVLALASAESLARYVWIVLPAGLLIAILSWTYLGVLDKMFRDAAARAWRNVVPPEDVSSAMPLPPAAEAARAHAVDEARRKLVEE